MAMAMKRNVESWRKQYRNIRRNIEILFNKYIGENGIHLSIINGNQ